MGANTSGDKTGLPVGSSKGLDLLHTAYIGSDHLLMLVDPTGQPVYMAGAAAIDLSSLLPLPDARPEPEVIALESGEVIVAGLDPGAGHLLLYLRGETAGPRDRALVSLAATSVDAVIGRMMTEERMRAAEEVAVVGDLTSRYAHQLKNLLAVIRGSVDLLDRLIDGSRAPVDRVVRRLRKQTADMESLALALLAMRRQYASPDIMVDADLVLLR